MTKVLSGTLNLGFLMLLSKIAILVVVTYSVPLGLVYLSYVMCLELVRRQLRFKCDLVILGIILILGLSCFNLHVFLEQLRVSITIFKHVLSIDAINQVMNYQVSHLAQLYKDGLFIVLVLPLGLRIIRDFYHETLAKRTAQPLVDNMDNESISQGVWVGEKKLNISLKIILSDKELNQHCLVVGTTGAGKTTTLLTFVDSAASRGLPLVYLDGKGSLDLADKLQVIADKYGRKLKVFSLRPKESIQSLACYNPLSSGTATEWKNRIMALFGQAEGRGQEHFSLGEQNYINFVANVLAKLNKPVDLRVFLAFLEHPDMLLATAHEIDATMGRKIAQLHNENENIRTLVGDVVKLLELFIYSDYGKLFSTVDQAGVSQDNVIKLKESILNKEMVLFLFDASAYPEDTRKVAKMVINDLNSSFSDMGEFTKCFCIFDEFASYASDNLAETVSLQRSNGMHAIIGTQSITTVKLKAPDTKRIAEELIACCNTYIIQALNHVEDAETLSKVMGTRKALEVTSQIDSKVGGATGLGYVKRVDEFKIHPQTLKDLRTGEAIIYRKASELNPIKVKIRNIN